MDKEKIVQREAEKYMTNRPLADPIDYKEMAKRIVNALALTRIEGDEDGLIAPESISKIVYDVRNEGVDLGWDLQKVMDTMVDRLLKAQQALTKSQPQKDLYIKPQIVIPKDMVAWLLRRLNGKDASEFMLAMATDKPLTEVE